MKAGKDSLKRLETFRGFDGQFLNGRSWIVGIDEAGRGCLAGPVCAGAVAISARLYSDEKNLSLLRGVNDSKKLSQPAREDIFEHLQQLKLMGLIDFEAAYASVEEIEKFNILSATQVAMERACSALNLRNNMQLRRKGDVATLFGESALDCSLAEILIDGIAMKKFPYVHRAVVKGDASSLAIAAASIVAKVSRDKYMAALPSKYAHYMFSVNKGYATAAHLQALMLYGASDIHRPSFLKKLRAAPIEQKQRELF